MLYTQCIDHIKRKHESGCTITIFNVPGFVLGRPTFTHTHAVRYVAEKLCRGKFDVKVDGPLIYIDWEARIKEARNPGKRTSARANQRAIAAAIAAASTGSASIGSASIGSTVPVRVQPSENARQRIERQEAERRARQEQEP